MILVTGGAGFIGSVIVKELNNQGREDILIVDCLDETSKWQNLRSLKYENYLHAAELFNDERGDLLDQVTEIFHLGACSTTTEKDMDFLFRNNIHFSQLLCELAVKKEIPFYYASSAATYGQGDQGYSDSHDCVDSLRPLNPYGYSKQFFDQWMLSRTELPPLWYGFKFFNVFGPNEYHKGGQKSVVHTAFCQIEEVGSVKLFKSYRDDYKDGEQLRDFVYVLDCVEAIMKLRKVKAESGLYNLGTGKARSFLDLAKAVFNAMDRPEEIKFIDMPNGLDEQYQYFTQAETDKLKNALPDFHFKDLEESVAHYIQEFLLTPDPYM
jgi:ADP-L-glycero-D-manno-heptose 6-epimerase